MLVRAVLQALLLRFAAAGIYPFEVTFDVLEIESLTEGPMVAATDAFPFPTISTSSVAVDVRAQPRDASETHTIGVMLTRDQSMQTSLPVEVLECRGDDLENPDYTVRYFNTPQLIKTEFEVKRTGEAIVVIFACPCSAPGAMDAANPDLAACGIASGIDFEGTIAFSSPWGFLAASSVAYLYYYGALMVAYVALFVVYGALAHRHRAHATWLHKATLGVIAVGAAECLSMFMLYMLMNITGQPACCPAPLLALTSTVLNTLKRAVSRVLVLLICTGVGVVRPTLDRCRAGGVAAVGSLFFLLVLCKDAAYLESNGSPKAHLDALSLPVLILDSVFLTWIFYALAQITEELQDASDWTSTKQSKLKMYKSLNATLIAFSFIWVLLVFFAIAHSRGLFAISWRLEWLFHSFWHSCYFAILVTIAAVWRPSPTSDLLGFWFKGGAAESDVDEWSGLGLSTPHNARSGGGGYGSGGTSARGIFSARSINEAGKEGASLIHGGGGGGGGGSGGDEV